MFSQNQTDVKLEWMYKGAQSSVDREDYLLGKSVDKSLEQLNAQEKQQQQQGLQPPKNHVEHECIPPSIRDYKEQIGEQVDINAKLQEDPLIAIKKQEEEKRRQFLNNPIQIKKLQKALKMQKNIKKKKHKHSKSDSEEELEKKLAKKLKSFKSAEILKNKSPKTSKDSMLDTILMHKYNQLKAHLSQNDLTNILDGKKDKSSSESNSDSDASNGSSEKGQRERNIKYKQRHHRKSSSEEERKPSRKHSYKRQHSRESQKKIFKGRSDNDDHYRRSYHSQKQKSSSNFVSRSEHRSNERESFNKKKPEDNQYQSSSESETGIRKRSWGLVRADGTKIPLVKSSSDKMQQPKSDKSKEQSKSYRKRERLTEEEKEQRRQEMMRNALWRDKERANNLKVYRENKSKEESQKDYNPDFLNKELLKSANNSSVESRIKANINNIQRFGNDMSRHFSKR